MVSKIRVVNMPNTYVEGAVEPTYLCNLSCHESLNLRLLLPFLHMLDVHLGKRAPLSVGKKINRQAGAQ